MHLEETWWSPAAACYRVEHDGEMLTFMTAHAVADHFKAHDYGALVPPPPRGVALERLVRVLEAAGVHVEYLA